LIGTDAKTSDGGKVLRRFEHAARQLRGGANADDVSVAHGLYRADLDVEVASMVLAGGYDRVARELVRGERKPDLAKLLATLQRVCLTGIASPRLAAVVDQPVNKKNARHDRNPARIHVVSTRKRRNGTRGASK